MKTYKYDIIAKLELKRKLTKKEAKYHSNMLKKQYKESKLVKSCEVEIFN